MLCQRHAVIGKVLPHQLALAPRDCQQMYVGVYIVEETLLAPAAGSDLRAIEQAQELW